METYSGVYLLTGAVAGGVGFLVATVCGRKRRRPVKVKRLECQRCYATLTARASLIGEAAMLHGWTRYKRRWLCRECGCRETEALALLPRP